MAEPFLGEIIMFAGNFAPRGWALCDGQLLPINSYQALFSLLGTTYGGDGRTTFGLPDLRGRAPVHAGSGSGLDTIRLGQKGGANNAQLSVNNLPAHAHTTTILAQNEDVDTNVPTTSTHLGANGPNSYTTETGAAVNMPGSNTGNAGGNQQFNIMQPYQGVNFIIALQGVFPSRN